MPQKFYQARDISPCMSPVGPIGGPNLGGFMTSTVLSHGNMPLMNTTIPLPTMSAEDEASLQLNM